MFPSLYPSSFSLSLTLFSRKFFFFFFFSESALASLLAQMVKNLPAMHETRVQALGQEDSLEKGMAAHSSILAWRLPWTEEPGGLQSMVLRRVGRN